MTPPGPPGSDRAGARKCRATRNRRAASAVTLTRPTLAAGAVTQLREWGKTPAPGRPVAGFRLVTAISSVMVTARASVRKRSTP